MCLTSKQSNQVVQPCVRIAIPAQTGDLSPQCLSESGLSWVSWGAGWEQSNPTAMSPRDAPCHRWVCFMSLLSSSQLNSLGCTFFFFWSTHTFTIWSSGHYQHPYHSILSQALSLSQALHGGCFQLSPGRGCKFCELCPWLLGWEEPQMLSPYCVWPLYLHLLPMTSTLLWIRLIGAFYRSKIKTFLGRK